MTEPHVHQWKRWPVVDLSVDYACAVCEKPVTIMWTLNPGATLDDLDQQATRIHGGIFAGEFVQQPSQEEQMRRFAEMAQVDLPGPRRADDSGSH